jgi:SAM-dependent methyltransferase
LYRAACSRTHPSLPVQHHQKAALGYDLWTGFGQACRQAAVEKLGPAAGSTVLDVGCGTGWNFAKVEEGAIGPSGRLIGIDVSPAMLARPRERVQRERWRIVTLIEAAVQEAAVLVLADTAPMSAPRNPALASQPRQHCSPGTARRSTAESDADLGRIQLKLARGWPDALRSA